MSNTINGLPVIGDRPTPTSLIFLFQPFMTAKGTTRREVDPVPFLRGILG